MKEIDVKGNLAKTVKDRLTHNKPKQKGENMATLNKCRFWGENRADEYFFDVGCVLGHSYCKNKECKDYQEKGNK